MSTVNSAKPYEGNEKYIYIGRSVKDSEVLPVIGKLCGDGCRVWFSEENGADTDWPGTSTDRLEGCSVYMVFISANAAAARSCRREVNLAVTKKKTVIAVILEQTDLPLGLELQLSSVPRICKYQFSSDSEFYKELYAAKGVAECIGERPDAAGTADSTKPEEDTKASEPDSLRDTADRLIEQGTDANDCGDPEGAITYYMRAAEMYEQLTSETDDEEALDTLSDLYMEISDIFEAMGDEAQNAVFLEKSVDVFARQCMIDGTYENLPTCIESYDKFGEIRIKDGDYAEASISFRKGLRLREFMVEKDPSLENLKELARGYAHLVQLSMQYEDDADAREFLEKEAEIHEKIARESDDPENRRKLAKNYWLLGYFSDKLDDSGNRLKYYKKAFEVASAVSSDTGNLEDYRVCANCLAELGRYYAEHDEYADAKDNYFRAVKILEKLLEHGNDPEDRSNLDSTLKAYETVCRLAKGSSGAAEGSAAPAAPAASSLSALGSSTADLSAIFNGGSKAGPASGRVSSASAGTAPLAVAPALKNISALTAAVNNAFRNGLITLAETDGKQYIIFGEYAPDVYARGVGHTGTNKKLPILWEVLDYREDCKYALLLCRDIIIFNHYADKPGIFFGGWKDSVVRQELNTVFPYSAFTMKQRKALVTASLTNPDNPVYNVKGGKNTDDKVFVLSIKEAETYFPGGKEARIRRIRKDIYNKPCGWWLRTPGENRKSTAIISHDGAINAAGCEVTSDLGVCPAIWLNLK